MYTDGTGNSNGSLRPTSNINIFAGENNSGKSRFMKLLSDKQNIKQN